MVILSGTEFSFKWLKNYLFSHPTKEVADRNEKPFQTYLIVFGLLLTINIEGPSQQQLMKTFLAFILAGLFYYVALSRFCHHFHRYFLNFFALIMGFLFSYGFITCSFALKSSGGVFSLSR